MLSKRVIAICGFYGSVRALVDSITGDNQTGYLYTRLVELIHETEIESLQDSEYHAIRMAGTSSQDSIVSGGEENVDKFVD